MSSKNLQGTTIVVLHYSANVKFYFTSAATMPACVQQKLHQMSKIISRGHILETS